MLEELPIVMDLKMVKFHCPTHDRQMTRYECSVLRLAVMDRWQPTTPPKAARPAKSCLTCCYDNGKDTAESTGSPARKYTHKVSAYSRPRQSIAGLRCKVCKRRARDRQYNFKRGTCKVCCTRAYRAKIKIRLK